MAVRFAGDSSVVVTSAIDSVGVPSSSVIVIVPVAVEMDAEADEKEVIENCDYFFDNSAIKSTEIQEIFTEKEMQQNGESDLYGLASSNFA